MHFSDDDVEVARHVVQRILVPCVFVIGLLGNSVSIYVLTRKSMRCTTNIYLTALAITDIIYLSMVLLLSLQHYEYVHLHWHWYWKLYGTIVWLVDGMAYLSIYIAVGFTIERFIAIRYPLKRQTFCTESLAKKVVAGMAIFCLVSTISTALEHQPSESFRLMDNHGKPCNRTPLALLKLETNSITLPPHAGDAFEILMPGEGGSGAGAGIASDHNDDVIMKSADQSEYPAATELLISPQLRREEAMQRPQRSLDEQEVADLMNMEHIPIQPTSAVSLSAAAATPDAAGPNDESFSAEMLDSTLSNGAQDNKEISCRNVTYYSHRPTALALDDIYSDVWAYVSIIVYFLIPLCLLTTFNCFLVTLVRRSHAMRDKMTNASSIRRPKGRTSATSVSQENRVTITLIAVVICFLICQVPWAMYLIVTLRCNLDANLQKILGNILNFLANINAAANFFLYCVLSDKYRKTVRCLLGSKMHQYDRSAMTTASMYTSVSRCSYRPTVTGNSVKK